MRILILTQYFLPQPLANAEVVGGLATQLAAMGHDVHVLTPAPGAAAPGVRAHRAPGYFPADRASTWKRLLEYVAFSAVAPLVALTVPRPDIVLAPSPPPTHGVVGLIIAGMHRAKLVYNVQDLDPEVALATGAVRANLFLSALGRLMRLVYRRSAAVFVIDPFFVPKIQAAAPSATVVAIRNGIDLSPFAHAVRDERFLREVGAPPDRPVVMYAGNVGRSQDLDGVIEAAGRAGACLVIHGGGATLDQLRAEVASRGLEHVRFSGFRPRAEIGLVFASADVHVVPLKAGIAASSVPSKLLSIFAAGRPAVVTAELASPTAALVESTGAGWITPPGDVDALAIALRSALADRAELDRRGRLGRAWAMAEAGADRAAREYDEALRRLVPEL